MKIPRNVRLVQEVVEILQKSGIEPSNQTVTSWIMAQVVSGSFYAAKYGKIKPGAVAKYFREYHVQTA